MRPGELFVTAPGFLPSLDDDETLFSWGARYHRRSGNAHPRDSSRILYGDETAGSRHDLPSHVGNLVDRTAGLVGTGESLILRHTIFGAFAKFLDPETITEALSMMHGPSIYGLKGKLGLLTSGLGADHPLKGCHQCIEEDMATGSGARWRVEHQWPSVWVCRRHGAALSQVLATALTRKPRPWLLPDSVSRDDWIEFPPLNDYQLERLSRLATLTAGIAEMSERSLDLSLLRLTYFFGGNARGFIVTSDGSVRFKAMLEALKVRSADLLEVPGWEFLSQLKTTHGGLLGLLMRRVPGNHHLAKHVALIDFLFDSFEQFSACYHSVVSSAENGTIDDRIYELHSTREQIINLVQIEGLSINKAAAQVGVHTALAVRWIKREGIPYQARPRVLDRELKAKLLWMLRAGRTREEIVENLAIKKSWLRAFLADHLAIRDRWLQKLTSIRRNVYRETFLELMRANVGVPIRRIKAMPGNGFTWLYNHDREWLMAHLPTMPESEA